MSYADMQNARTFDTVMIKMYIIAWRDAMKEIEMKLFILLSTPSGSLKKSYMHTYNICTHRAVTATYTMMVNVAITPLILQVHNIWQHFVYIMIELTLMSKLGITMFRLWGYTCCDKVSEIILTNLASLYKFLDSNNLRNFNTFGFL